MALEAIAAHQAQARNAHKPAEVFQDRSTHQSPFSRVRDGDPVDFSGSTLGTGLTRNFSLKDYLTPEAPRSTVGRQDKASIDIPLGPLAILAATGSYIGVMTEVTKRIEDPKKRALARGLVFGAPAGLACLVGGAIPYLTENAPAPFVLTAESAVPRIQERGSSFMIGNTPASLSDISCDSNGGTFSKITLKDDRSSDLSTAAFCTAKIKVGETLGAVGLVVSDTGDVFIANVPGGHFSISFDGKDATGQLALLTADHKLEQNTNASFGATLVDGKVSSISWVRIADKTSTVDKSSSKESTDSFVSLVSKPEFMQVSAVISAALTAPEFTLTTDSTPTPRPTETQTPSATATETNTPVPTAESAAIALFDKYNVDPATYTLAEVNGVIVGTDNETGTEIFRDGRFEIGFAVELAKKDCEPTDFEPNQYGLLQDKDLDSFGEYFAKLLGDTNDNNFSLSDNMRFSDVLVDRAKQCWAITNGDAFLYRVETDRVSVIPIIHLTKDEVIEFSFGRE